MQSNYKYAKTLLDLSKKSDSVLLIQNQLKSISYLYSKIPAFKLVFITKRIEAVNKIEIIKLCFETGNSLFIDYLLPKKVEVNFILFD